MSLGMPLNFILDLGKKGKMTLKKNTQQLSEDYAHR